MVLRLQIISHSGRNHAISLITSSITGCGGWVIDHHLFSNMAASINFECPGAALTLLVEELTANSLSPDVVGDLPKTPDDVRCCLTITFIHDDPDMKRDVPAFS